MKHSSYAFFILGSAFAILASNAPAGVVTPTSSNRVVSVLNRETLPQTTVTMTGPSLGAWQSQAQSINDVGQPNFNPNGAGLTVTSSQQSNFSAAGVTFTGFVFIDYNGVALPQLGSAVSNRSDTTFHVQGDCDYLLGSTFAANSVAQFTNSISLRSTGGQQFFTLSASGSRAGTLPTGDYILSILITGSSSGSQTADVRSQIDATFTIPAPAVGLVLLAPLVLATRRGRSMAAHP